MNQETEKPKQKKCPYKKIFGNTCLVIILAIFCTLEIAVLGLIFAIFLVVYIAILIAGACYLSYVSIRNIIKHYSNKSSTQD
ncbi:hypothetical protein FLM55_04230 [Francisella sp. Scap27]|uniref:hypothetical protein n=1 Tax=Francisella sp. Scap27 TaxID=2589986 RepID=UPI0015BEA0EA|nr:hypothetical protein [Francisella sp. Scap27]QLE78983.1 hypothetical protein FLM55_04230 [Francisella sp. Scap27]